MSVSVTLPFSSQHVVWRFIVRWLRSTQAEAPLLLAGWDTRLSTTVVEILSRLAVCERGEELPCLACPRCQQADSVRPDIITLTGDTKTISIAELRTALKELSHTAFAHRRLVIVPDAERLTIPAANAFLKTLEEVAGNARFVLTTRFPGRLPLSIRSRCQLLTLPSSLSADLVQEVSPTELSKLFEEPRLLRRLSYLKQAENISDADLVMVGLRLSQLLRQGGPTPALRASFMRLRDFCVIRAARGNTKTAGEVLIAALAHMAPR
jgi:hypothetical protein